MFGEGAISTIAFLLIFSFAVVLASVAIPIKGYLRRRWKGVVIGCLMQPVVCLVLIGVVTACFFIYRQVSLKMQKNSAMVTVKSTEQGVNGTDTVTWYLKADEECLFVSEDITDLSDVVRLDSLKTGVSVEDRIVVRFDIENEKVSATDYDQPIEVLDVNWDKVKAYFNP